MKNAKVKKVLSTILSVVMVLAIVQPGTFSFADYCDDNFNADEMLPQTAETAVAEETAVLNGSEVENDDDDAKLTAEDVPEKSEDVLEDAAVPEDPDNIQDESAGLVFEENGDDWVLTEDGVISIDSDNTEETADAKSSPAEEAPKSGDALETGEIPAEQFETVADENCEVSNMSGLLAVVNPGTSRPVDPDLKTEQRFIRKETEDKIIETASHMVPFGSIIYNVIKYKSGKEIDASKAVEDIATTIVSSAVDTLVPGSGSLFSVIKDVTKKLFPSAPYSHPVQKAVEIL